jgi:hypothetical protein
MRVAIFAPAAFTFGWNRQVLQLADAREGLAASVFKDHKPALAWLKGDGLGGHGFGGSTPQDIYVFGDLSAPE